MKKYYSNGVSSQRTRALTLWFWICPCLTRAGEKTLWEHFSRILCFKCCPLWQKTSEPISGSGKQRVSRQQRGEVCALGDHLAPCDLSLPGRNLRKSQIIVKRAFLQKGVLSCKSPSLRIQYLFYHATCCFSSLEM